MGAGTQLRRRDDAPRQHFAARFGAFSSVVTYRQQLLLCDESRQRHVTSAGGGGGVGAAAHVVLAAPPPVTTAAALLTTSPSSSHSKPMPISAPHDSSGAVSSPFHDAAKSGDGGTAAIPACRLRRSDNGFQAPRATLMLHEPALLRNHRRGSVRLWR